MTVLWDKAVVPFGNDPRAVVREHYPFEVRLDPSRFRDAFAWFETPVLPDPSLPSQADVLAWLKENEYGTGASMNGQRLNRRARRKLRDKTPLFMLKYIGAWEEPALLHATRRWIGSWPTFRFRHQDDAVMFKTVWG